MANNSSNLTSNTQGVSIPSQMRVLITGSSGHLGEALVKTLRQRKVETLGVDILPSPYTDFVGSITDRGLVKQWMKDVSAVIHTATLHKPHVATHTRQEFIDTNITGTLNLLEEGKSANVSSFIFTSTTSVFGKALTPPPDQPAAWITEDVKPVPKNIYGVSKHAAEELCELFHRLYGIPCLILRTSRFFPEVDDDPEKRAVLSDSNLKAVEFLNRRVDIQDVVDAHLLALERAKALSFGRYIISATTPFEKADLLQLRSSPSDVVARLVPDYANVFRALNWSMPLSIDRVYINEKARRDLGWQPAFDFRTLIESLKVGRDYKSPLAREIGSKGYHQEEFANGPYPVQAEGSVSQIS